MASINLQFYNALWSDTHLEKPERFNTWPLMRALANSASERVEIGPGLRPRLPIDGTCFLDISGRAVEQLRQQGGNAMVGEVTVLPFLDQRFELVGAFDIIEHVADDANVFHELSRVLKDHGLLVFSVPLHAHLWTEFDKAVGHLRRYDPKVLQRLIAEHGFVIEKSAVFGMQPKSRWLLELGTWMLRHHRARAMRWYNGIFLPLGLCLQKPLQLEPGLISTDDAEEVLLVCRRRPRSAG